MKKTIFICALYLACSMGAFAKGPTAVGNVSAQSGTLQGTWSSSKPFCQLELKQTGNKVTGTYNTSPYPDGRKVQGGDIDGVVIGNLAHVTFSSSFANEKARGKLDLILIAPDKLKWKLINTAVQDYGEDYTPDKITLTKSAKRR